MRSSPRWPWHCARSRGDLIGAAAANTGKVFTESDSEVSEAIDFAEYYLFRPNIFSERNHVSPAARESDVVVSPWNFPIAIPCGGVAAALAAGNTVILKPASDTVLVAWQLCQCFWQAGVSQRGPAVRCPAPAAATGLALVTHPDVDVVILTGGTETGMAHADAKPDLNLLAETGGKNATIVTAMSDRDQAIKNVLHSAFSHSGQKCSATSLLILEEEVYEDELQTARWWTPWRASPSARPGIAKQDGSADPTAVRGSGTRPRRARAR